MANFSYRTALSDRETLELRVGGLYRHKIRYNIQDEYDLKPTTTSERNQTTIHRYLHDPMDRL